MKTASRILLIALLLGAGPLGAADPVLHLSIGDPDLREKEAPLVLDALTDARTGEVLAAAELVERLAGVRLVLVGESHTDFEFHRVQLRVIRALQEAGREVMVGLEMFPYTQQEHLDAWSAGDYTEEGFLRRAGWYRYWGAHWNYYRDVFLFARDHGLPMIALNTPREVVRKVRRDGFEALTEDEQRHVPREVATGSEEHMILFKSYFEDEEDSMHAMMTDEQWEGMLRAQATWDATMGHNAVVALAERGGPESVLVVLVGSGHLAYGLGIERQIEGAFEGGIASIIPVPVEDDDGDRVERVQASYADFLWGLPPAADPIYPVLGVSTRAGEGDGQRTVINVQEDSVGERAGFQTGDLLLSMDGREIRDKGDLARLVAGKRWGDSARVRIRRGEEEVELDVLFRREIAEEDEGE